MIDDRTPLFAGFIQSFLLSLYIFFVAYFMTNAEAMIGSFDNSPQFLGPMMALTLFIVSAMISATIVLGYPFYLFWSKKDLKRASIVLISTALFLIIDFITYLLTVYWLS